MYSEGTQYSKYPLGQRVVLPTIFATAMSATPSARLAPRTPRWTDPKHRRSQLRRHTGGGGSTPPTQPQQRRRQQRWRQPVGSLDLNAQIPAVVNGILSIADSNPIARQWLAMGGNRSMVGDAITGLLTTAPASSTRSSRTAASSLRRWAAWSRYRQDLRAVDRSRGVMSDIGLPISDEYSVDGGKRSDFERGSMIFDEVTARSPRS